MNAATVHNFATSLQASHDLEGASFWNEVYSSLFPDMVAFIRHSEGGDHQKLGIDTSVIMRNSKVYTVDEKLRYEDYGDIALEEIADTTHNTPGWIVKPLLCDYILYAVLPSGKAYLLPTLQLQAAWKTHGEMWKQTRTAIPSLNRDERTGRTWEAISWGILPEELFPAIGAGLRAVFNPGEGGA